MTPASPLSRLEKLAEEELQKIHAREPVNRVLSREETESMLREVFTAGGKALLQILSEQKEGHGPPAWILESDLKHMALDHAAFAWKKNCYPDDIEYRPVTELLQARAASAQELKMACDRANAFNDQVGEANRKLASSEARVRILSDALEAVRKYFNALDLPSHYVTLKETKELGKLARQALLEVQR